MHILYEEELLPLVGSLICTQTILGNPQHALPLVDVVQCHAAAGGRNFGITDQHGQIGAIREGLVPYALHATAEVEVVQIAASRECPIANLLHAIAHGHILQAGASIELVVVDLILCIANHYGTQRGIAIERGIAT